MAYNFAGGGDGDQVFLLPPDPRDWLPEGHLAWAVRRAAGELDLAPFLAAYRADGQGKRAYHPRMMVALVLYCYCKGIRSSRAVEMATFDDVGARVICGGLHPDHATCARFVTRHKEPLKGLLVQSLAACAREGLVRVDVMAGDGTKVKANASMAANATAEQLGLDIAGLEELLRAEVAAWIEQAAAADAAEDAWPGGGGDAPPPPGGTPAGAARARTAGMLARRKAAQAKLQAEARARQEQAEAERAERIAKLAAEKDRLEGRAAEELARGQAKVARHARRAAAAAAGHGRRQGGRAPWPAERQRDVRATAAAAARAAARLEAAIAAPAVAPARGRPAKANATDLASRVMPGKKGGYDQLYNLQALACRGPVIAAVATHDSTAGTYALHPLLAAAAANLAAAGIADRIGKALFDAGYASEANFTAGCGADLYVAVTRESVQAGQQPGGTAPLCGQPGWQAMAAKLDTPEGRAVYRQRKAIIEPVFAQLFARFGRTLHYRGDMVTTEIHLWAAVHNMLKAIRARTRREQRERQAAARPALAAA
jgi:transposase